MMHCRIAMLGLFLVFSPGLSAENPYSPEDSLKVRNACIELGTRYAHYLDTGQSDKIPTLFDEHGTWQGRTGKFTGREDIKLAFSRRPKNRKTIHIVSSYMVEIQSRNLAVVTSNFATYQSDEGKEIAPIHNQPFRAGRYIDECIRDGNRWIFQSRTMEELFGQIESQN